MTRSALVFSSMNTADVEILLSLVPWPSGDSKSSAHVRYTICDRRYLNDLTPSKHTPDYPWRHKHYLQHHRLSTEISPAAPSYNMTLTKMMGTPKTLLPASFSRTTPYRHRLPVLRSMMSSPQGPSRHCPYLKIQRPYAVSLCRCNCSRLSSCKCCKNLVLLLTCSAEAVVVYLGVSISTVCILEHSVNRVVLTKRRRDAFELSQTMTPNEDSCSTTTHSMRFN